MPVIVHTYQRGTKSRRFWPLRYILPEWVRCLRSMLFVPYSQVVSLPLSAQTLKLPFLSVFPYFGKRMIFLEKIDTCILSNT